MVSKNKTNLLLLLLSMGSNIFSGFFFRDAQKKRALINLDTYEVAHIQPNQLPPDHLIAYSDFDGSPATDKLALIVETEITDPATGKAKPQWVVGSSIIVEPASKEFNTLEEAQEFALAHLRAGEKFIRKSIQKNSNQTNFKRVRLPRTAKSPTRTDNLPSWRVAK